MGNSWLSKLWDRTVGSLGKKIAINWDHGGRTYVEAVAAIVAAYFGGVEFADAIYSPEGMEVGATTVAADGTITIPVTVTGDSGLLAGAVGAPGGISAGMAGTIADVAGGAAGGFISGASLSAMAGQNGSQVIEAGLEGAEYGAIAGGISGAEAGLNSSYLKLQPLAGSGWEYDIAILGGRGLEGAIANILEDKNASVGFWSGVLSGAGGFFNPQPGSPNWWTLPDDLAKGILGGLGSMNKHGKGFMTGFWSAEATAASTFVDNELKFNNPSGRGWENDAIGIAAKGVFSGAAARFGFKTFSSGLFTGLASEGFQDAFAALKGNPEKPPSFSGPITSAFNLLQPKMVHHHPTLPLDSIKAGTWGRGASWAGLYATQASGSP
jgi:hypothetical protein